MASASSLRRFSAASISFCFLSFLVSTTQTEFERGNLGSKLGGQCTDTLQGPKASLLSQCSMLLSFLDIQVLNLGCSHIDVFALIRSINGTENGGAHLIISQTELDNLINTTGSNEGLVQLLQVVGSHDKNTALLRSYTVKDVEETR
ncbi:hypothetical protein HG531_008600 [Fusarium graminearum]|nr:hypothetical protein HG531_008600 [Fusarium graminearum]